MTDRINMLFVALDKDLRDDDAAELKKAIMLLQGVLSVTWQVSDPGQRLAEERAKMELRNKILDLL